MTFEFAAGPTSVFFQSFMYSRIWRTRISAFFLTVSPAPYMLAVPKPRSERSLFTLRRRSFSRSSWVRRESRSCMWAWSASDAALQRAAFVPHPRAAPNRHTNKKAKGAALMRPLLLDMSPSVCPKARLGFTHRIWSLQRKAGISQFKLGHYLPDMAFEFSAQAE
jgi:hypothetical protein